MSKDRATIVGAPSPIWLILGDGLPAEEIQFSTLEEVTWCEDKQDADDIEYVLKSTVAALTASHAALLDALEHMKGCRWCAEDSWEDCEGGRAALAAIEVAKELG